MTISLFVAPQKMSNKCVEGPRSSSVEPFSASESCEADLVVGGRMCPPVVFTPGLESEGYGTNKDVPKSQGESESEIAELS